MATVGYAQKRILVNAVASVYVDTPLRLRMSARFDPPICLAPGDVVEVEAPVSVFCATPSPTRFEKLTSYEIEQAASALDKAECKRIQTGD